MIDRPIDGEHNRAGGSTEVLSMRTLIVACVAAATLAMSPALAGYAWSPTVSWRDYYAYQYNYHLVAPDGRYWSRGYRHRWPWRR
jgi:hypothetical protein